MKWKSTGHSRRGGDAKRNFQRLLSDPEGYAEFETQQSDDFYARSELFSYAISALGTILEGEMALSIFMKPDSWESSFSIPGASVVQERQETKLSPFHVAALPCEKSKLLDALQGVFTYGFHRDWNYTNGLLIQELDFVAIVNGGHHLSAARLYREGSACLDVYTLASAFPTTSTDGEWWYIIKNGTPKKEGPVPDYRYAVMYELARRRAEMLGGEARPMPPGARLAKLERPDPEDDAANWAIYGRLDELRRENYLLQENNKLLLRRLATAEGKGTGHLSGN